jgi:hypothetical protein
MLQLQTSLLSYSALWAAVIGLAGTAIGGFIGIAGSLISNRHDARQRDREREMSLRTSVYLEAAEAVVRSQALIGSLANPDLPEIQAMATYQQDVAALGKIQVVGTEETFVPLLRSATHLRWPSWISR